MVKFLCKSRFLVEHAAKCLSETLEYPKPTSTSPVRNRAIFLNRLVKYMTHHSDSNMLVVLIPMLAKVYNFCYKQCSEEALELDYERTFHLITIGSKNNRRQRVTREQYMDTDSISLYTLYIEYHYFL